MGTYRYSGSANIVTVGQTGTFDIVAFGAQGGADGQNAGGLGAEVGGTFSLTAGTKLEIIAGGSGGDDRGGGGGSFVLANYGGTSGTYVPLIIAGGGGGAARAGNGGAGLATSGTGFGGYAGRSPDDPGGVGAGGAGVKSNGESSYYKGNIVDHGGYNKSGGYAGGRYKSMPRSPSAASTGGFGGGGAGFNTGGGGGGYSGGAGGYDNFGKEIFDPGSGGGSYNAGLPIAGDTVSGENGGNGRVIVTPNIVCFAAGTYILTTDGPIAVEALAAEDLVVTLSHKLRPIRWLGHRTIDCRNHPSPCEVVPVRISAHAFGESSPSRDLFLSPGHPVLVDADENGAGGHLVPIMCLINGTTIERAPVETVTYWHVELDQHDILLADGLPAESYIDLGSRPWFDGADGALYDPDMAAPGIPSRCRPVAIDGPVVEMERRRLDGVFAMRLAGACAWPSGEDAAFTL